MTTLRRCALICLITGLLAITACEPLVPTPTPQVIVVTPTFTPGPSPTTPPTLTPTPAESPTPTTPPPTPTPAIVCTQDEGQIIAVDDFQSAIAERNLPYRIYLPPCYFEAQRRYPVVYLLHASAEDDTHWENLGLASVMNTGLDLNQFPPMIVVMPYGSQLHSENIFPPDPSMETYLLEELIPRVERDLCVWESREHRAIGGISRGGFWALSIAMRNPDVFSKVGGHSAALFTDNARPAANPLDLALTAPFLEDTLQIYLDHAANDPVRSNLEIFSTRLSQRRIPHEYVINPLGDHDNAYWSSHLADYLAFYGGDAQTGWPRDLAALPSCLEPSP